jgi:hypothetical protein
VNLLNREEIFTLAEHEGTPSVSLLIPQTRPHDPRKSQIRIKNLVAKAEDILEGMDLRPQQRENLLSEARSLLSNPVFGSIRAQALPSLLPRGFPGSSASPPVWAKW